MKTNSSANICFAFPVTLNELLGPGQPKMAVEKTSMAS